MKNLHETCSLILPGRPSLTLSSESYNQNTSETTHQKNGTDMRRVNATAFELVRLQLKPQSAFWGFDTSTSAPAKKAHKYSTPNMRFDQVVDWISMTTERVQKR